MRTRRDGFTLLELMMAVLIVGILARVAMPTYQDMVYRARAASAVGVINAVRVAAYSYNADTNEWPADVWPGILPPELEPYLGEEFSFSSEHYELDWENWMTPDGSPTHPETGVLLGVSITTTDAQLGAALESLLGSSRAHYTLGDNYTFVIFAAN